jgi:hypothetical protein
MKEHQMKARNQAIKYGVALGSFFAAASANAAIDVTAVTTKLSEGEVAVAAIGGAILIVWAIKRVYSMIRG